MDLLAEYLERARQFELLAGETKDDASFKRMLLRQAGAYRMLAVKRAGKLHLPRPPLAALQTERSKIEFSHHFMNVGGAFPKPQRHRRCPTRCT
jgi:hypothetical protein